MSEALATRTEKDRSQRMLEAWVEQRVWQELPKRPTKEQVKIAKALITLHRDGLVHIVFDDDKGALSIHPIRGTEATEDTDG